MFDFDVVTGPTHPPVKPAAPPPPQPAATNTPRTSGAAVEVPAILQPEAGGQRPA